MQHQLEIDKKKQKLRKSLRPNFYYLKAIPFLHNIFCVASVY